MIVDGVFITYGLQGYIGVDIVQVELVLRVSSAKYRVRIAWFNEGGYSRDTDQELFDFISLPPNVAAIMSKVRLETTAEEGKQTLVFDRGKERVLEELPVVDAARDRYPQVIW